MIDDGGIGIEHNVDDGDVLSHVNEENVVLMILNNVGEEYDDDSVDDDIDDADHPIAVHDSVEQ